MIGAVKQRELSDRVSGGLDSQIAKLPVFHTCRMSSNAKVIIICKQPINVLITLFCLHFLFCLKFRLVAGCQKGLIFMRITLIASHFESCHNTCTKQEVGFGPSPELCSLDDISGADLLR